MMTYSSGAMLWAFLLHLCTSNAYQVEKTTRELEAADPRQVVNGPWCWWVEVPFAILPQAKRDAAQTLRWDQHHWDVVGVEYGPVFVLWPDTVTWEELDDDEKFAAEELGFDVERWRGRDHQDCVRTGPCPIEGICGPVADYGEDWCKEWVNYQWLDMHVEYRLALTVLGFERNTWNNGLDDNDQPRKWPGQDFSWHGLDREETEAAEYLGFDETKWINEAHLRACEWRGVCIFGCMDESSNNCLSGHSQVHVLGKGDTFVKDTSVGDKVLVSKSAATTRGDYQEIYAFGHRDVYAEANFLQIETSGNQKMPLEITAEHLLVKQNSGTGNAAVRADSIRIGDILVGIEGDSEVVTKISHIKRNGLYSPLTKDGTIIANGVEVSSYTAAQDQSAKNYVVGSFDLISHHLMSHIAIGPFRSICLFMSGYAPFCDIRNGEGQLLYAAEGDKLISWIQGQSTEIQIIVLTFLLLTGMSFYILEKLFGFAILFSFPLVVLLGRKTINTSFMQKN